jgi:hypothetical protein
VKGKLRKLQILISMYQARELSSGNCGEIKELSCSILTQCIQRGVIPRSNELEGREERKEGEERRGESRRGEERREIGTNNQG